VRAAGQPAQPATPELVTPAHHKGSTRPGRPDRSWRYRWSGSCRPLDLAPQNAPHKGGSHRFSVRIPRLSCVELRGFEPRTSCMPPSGRTSTAVHTCRSPSQDVRTSPPESRPVAVLSCCTAQPVRNSPGNANQPTPDQPTAAAENSTGQVSQEPGDAGLRLS